MNTFQILAIAGLAVLFARDLFGFARTSGQTVFRLMRCVVWVAAAVAIRRPDWVQEIAFMMGIGRGADAILYGFVLAFLWVSFWQYSQYLRLQRDLTQVVRYV
ncbi:MAG: DUF2304 family protein, partial [Gemmataceae bacterium]